MMQRTRQQVKWNSHLQKHVSPQKLLPRKEIKKAPANTLLILHVIYFYQQQLASISYLDSYSSLTSFVSTAISWSYFWTHVAFTSTHVTVEKQYMILVFMCIFHCWGYLFTFLCVFLRSFMMSQSSRFSSKITWNQHSCRFVGKMSTEKLWLPKRR